MYHVGDASNTYSVEIDGLHAGGGGPRTGWRACHFSALHLFAEKNKEPDENSAFTTVRSLTINHRHDVICVFDRAQSMGKTFCQSRSWATGSFEKLASSCTVCRQEGHVIPRPKPRSVNFNRKIRMREGAPTLEDAVSPSCAGGDSVAEEFVSSDTSSCRARKATEETDDFWIMASDFI